MKHQRWTREQDLAVLHGKLSHHHGFDNHPDTVRLAANMGRSLYSLTMRKRNFDWLDPLVGTGLSNAARLTHMIWDEYDADPDRLMAEARRAYLEILSLPN